jgi:uncharacterized protein (TIGR03437 family)
VLRFLWAFLCCPCFHLLAQPAIGQNGVVNRASQIPSTLPGGSIARGAAFTIRGVHFRSGAVVRLKKEGASSPVRLLAIEPEKIEAIMPNAAPLGAASLVVNTDDSASLPFPIDIAASNPGIFSQNKKGWGPGQIENIDPQGKRTLNTTINPAHPGQRVVVRITGLGRGAAAIVVIGNRTANAGLTRSIPQSGEQEFSLAIPSDAPAGCYVPVYLQASATRASNVVTIAVRSGLGPCDPGPVALLDTNRIGLAVISRANIRKDGQFATTDEAVAVFTAKGSAPALSPLLLIPPPGTCTSYASSLQAATVLPDSVAAALVAELGGDLLAAGSQLSVARGEERRVVPGHRRQPGYYRARLGSSNAKSRGALSLFLEPGGIVLSGPGGLDVGPFRVLLDAPAPFEWIDRDWTQIVERGRALPVHWRGQASDHWTILLAANVDQITTAIGRCLCTAPLNATHFEIPAALLANIPASVDLPGVPYDQLFVASLPAKSTPIAAAGLGAGAVVTIYANGRFVQYH